MNMKDHILAALREQLNLWEKLLASLSSEQVTAPLLPSHWTVKDVLVHLWAWQQRSIARVEAALQDRDPEFQTWVPGLDPDTDVTADQTNAWIYQAYHNLPWPQVKQNWEEGFQRFLALSEQVAEKDLLDGNKYRWLGGSSLAAILIASYDHHQEHYEKFRDWLAENS